MGNAGTTKIAKEPGTAMGRPQVDQTQVDQTQMDQVQMDQVQMERVQMERVQMERANTDRTEAQGSEAVRSLLAEPIAAIESFLDAWTRSLGQPAVLGDAVRYALLSGGKRLRPVLSWYAACAVARKPGGDAVLRVVPAAASVELVHAFSLVHDDLPAMDDDDMRRGVPTLHVRLGEAAAILAGDAMLAMGFAVLDATPPAGPRYEPALRGLLASELAAGTMGMIDGQVYDTLGGFADGLSDAERVELTHRNKTGALLRASCRLGGLVMTDGQAGSDIESLTVYADAIGLMYQIVDDLIDVEQASEHTGKRTKKDADAGKLTYPAVLGASRSRELISELEATAASAVRPFGTHGEPLRVLLGYLAKRSR